MATPLSERFKKPNIYFDSFRKDIIDHVPFNASRILDIGCSSGNFGKALKERQNCEVWGIEIDEASALQAKNKLDKVISGDALQSLKHVPENYFDLVICNDVLEHLYDPWGTLELIKTCLKPEGVIVASIPNVRYFRCLFKLLFSFEWKYDWQGVLDYTHVRFFTKKTMKQMFADTGFEIIEIKGINSTKSIRPYLLNFLFLGFFSDTMFLQFLIKARPFKINK